MEPYVEINSLYHPKGSYPFQPISGLSFDVLEERLWLHDADGYLASYTVPECLPYSSIRTCYGTTYDDTEWSVTSLSRTAVRPIACARCVVCRARARRPPPAPSPLTLLPFTRRPTRRAPARAAPARRAAAWPCQ